MRVRFIPPAADELIAAAEWYAAQANGLEAKFITEVEAACRRIEQYPEAWHPLGGDLRRARLNRFPYGLIYAIRDGNAVILAVAHLHREPNYWKSRDKS